MEIIEQLRSKKRRQSHDIITYKNILKRKISRIITFMLDIIIKPCGRGVCNNLTHFNSNQFQEKVLQLLA